MANIIPSGMCLSCPYIDFSDSGIDGGVCTPPHSNLVAGATAVPHVVPSAAVPCCAFEHIVPYAVFGMAIPIACRISPAFTSSGVTNVAYIDNPTPRSSLNPS